MVAAIEYEHTQTHTLNRHAFYRHLFYLKGAVKFIFLNNCELQQTCEGVKPKCANPFNSILKPELFSAVN